MYVNIRRNSPADEHGDPVALLLACHRRIRDFTALSLRLGGDLPASPEDVAESAARVRRYFTVALPLHAADEDLSLRPRLVAAGAGAAVLEATEEVARQHVEIDAVIATLDPLWAALVREPGRRGELSRALLDASRALDARWREHLSLEERVVFPAAASALTPEARLALRDEMRARRPASGFAPLSVG